MPLQIVQIIGGHLTIVGWGPPAYQFFTASSVLTTPGGEEGVVPLQVNPHQAGTLSIGARYSGSLALGRGFARIGTTSYQSMWYVGNLTISGTVKLLDTMPEPVVIERPFTLAGRMKGYLSNPFVETIDPPIFDYRVKGSGKAIIEFTSIMDQGVRLFDFRKVTYNFL